MTKSEKKKTCFVVGQIGGDDSPERIHSDWVLEEIITPVISDIEEFTVIRADKVTAPGLIDTQIISELLTCELVIADLTGLNANAFYEIGIRHVVQKPIIHMHLAGQTIPFDISLFRSLKFSIQRPSEIKKARTDLMEMVRTVLAEGYEVENPVTNARGRIAFNETATPSDRLIREEIDAVKERLSIIEVERALANEYVPSPAAIESDLEARRQTSSSGSFKLKGGIKGGDRVSHQKFGPGIVVSVENSKITVDFIRAGRRTVLSNFLTSL